MRVHTTLVIALAAVTLSCSQPIKFTNDTKNSSPSTRAADGNTPLATHSMGSFLEAHRTPVFKHTLPRLERQHNLRSLCGQHPLHRFLCQLDWSMKTNKMTNEFKAQLQKYVVEPYKILWEQYSHRKSDLKKDDITIMAELLLQLYESAGLLDSLTDVPAYSEKARATARWLLMAIEDKADDHPVRDFNTQNGCFVPSGCRNMSKEKGRCWIVCDVGKRASRLGRPQNK
ncbi:hypothetical protein AOQ84DRAFT_62480 [Glonium stellatum]|uniref:Uncharacterized protein n=1 Tax=Glonium stellatum TaxID=574774 RepID=A0A8E2EYH2_9PEZI|nr:hypothetical protein AOQ84DRAFT_62480 [Glonium stellatum]